MIAGNWFFTPHAVRRFQAYYGGMAYNVALGVLIRLSHNATLVGLHPSRQHPARKAELWMVLEPLAVRFVVMPAGLNWRQPQVVTVLPPRARDGKRRTADR